MQASTRIKLMSRISGPMAVLGLIALLWARDGHAREAYCADLSAFSSQQRTCGKNFNFVVAANGCLAKLSQEIEQKKAQLVQLMAQSNASVAGAQGATFSGNNSNLAQAESVLANLLLEAAVARANLVGYEQALDLPGPISKDQAARLHILGLLERVPCFKNNYKGISQDIATVDAKTAELSNALNQLKKVSGRSKADLQQMNSLSGNSVHSGAAVGQSEPKAVKKGRNVPPQSTVTGIVEDENKRNAIPVTP